MKKAIKIFSILGAILVAVFTATFFNSNFKVSANTLETTKDYFENENLTRITLIQNKNQVIFTYDKTQNTTDFQIFYNIEELEEDNLQPSVNNSELDINYIKINEITLGFDDFEDIELIQNNNSLEWDYNFYQEYILNEDTNLEIEYELTVRDTTDILIPTITIKLTTFNNSTLIEDIFTETTTLLQKVVNFFVTAIQTVINLFWVAGTGLTNYGKLFLIPAGFAIFYKVMKWIGKLLRIR